MTRPTDDHDYPVARTFLQRASSALGLPARALEHVHFHADGVLPYVLPVDDFAAATVATAGVALRELLHVAGVGGTGAGQSAPARVSVDRRLTGCWFGTSLRPEGWALPPVWDSVAGDYRAADGWIRLHTNAAAHRAAALSVLGVAEDRAAVGAAVARWQAGDLERAVVVAGGCAAAMQTREQWRAHPQGQAVAAEPLVALATHSITAIPSWRPQAGRPLAGLKVLDLTRILAGPVSTRFLAGYGADVLRIDPPAWDEPTLVPDITLGKRCARLDLRAAPDRARFAALLAQADVLVHGYRPGALDGLGYDAAARRAINPALIDVTLDAYGWSGPWQGRRGFDSLVQMSSGIAHRGMVSRGADKPTPMPAQALDHGTGYLIAATVLRGLTLRLEQGQALNGRLSLARTAESLFELAGEGGMGESSQGAGGQPFLDARDARHVRDIRDVRDVRDVRDDDYATEREITVWGPALRARPPLEISGAAMRSDYPAGPLGAATAQWRISDA